MSLPVRFVANLIKPWDDLNALLSKPYALSSKDTEPARLAGSLAVSIRHEAEFHRLDAASDVYPFSPENRIICDVADAWKHHTLRQPSRQNELHLASQFECDSENRFRFIRNAIQIRHASDGQLDFLECAKSAISYWITRLQLPIAWNPPIAEGPTKFEHYATLYFNHANVVLVPRSNVTCFRKLSTGKLEPYDPPVVRFAIVDETDGSIRARVEWG